MSTKVVTAVPPKITAVSAIVPGKFEFRLRVRVIHYWTLPERYNSTDIGSLHMILLDDKCGKIQATVRKNLIPTFKEQIEVGSSYVFENLMVGSNHPSYKAKTHKYKLNFMQSTKVFKVNAPDIPQYHFDFIPFSEILSATKEDRLLDIIGHVVETNVVNEVEKNGKKSKVMDLTIEDLESNKIHCTLWEDFAEMMQKFMDNHKSSDPIIMILQLCKLKKFFGAMGVSNAYYGTKMMLNADLIDTANYISKMNGTEIEITQGVSQMSGPTIVPLADDLLQTQKMTIENLIESTEKCVGTVLARTCELERDLGWYYQACTKCASKVTTRTGVIYCDKCQQPRTAIPRQVI
ncbi:replication protein A 70 kDa DNA-binding subunit D-like [Vicia villosa]|uniref:replication protein A 70 kDa DNA-binding subunit D-like n=1 Tax=Vicia villosa TaxID=3911 RepID=UPI00273B9826|nr:replication protein A 70 kDa DNA-binding subunit D-like [Vicia villosa]